MLCEDKTASGVTIEVTDAAAQPLNSLTLYGWSTQQSTTGAQLLDLSSCAEMTAYELETIINAENGIITIQGTPTGNSSSNLSYRFLAPATVFEGKVFTPETLQQDGVASFYIYVATAGSSPLAIDMALTSVDAEICLRFRLMVVDTAADWEPYTGGVASPSPDYPQEITSAADSGEVAVTGNSQTLILAAANGLPGIPVASGGNYTDENGQQWVADEIVLNADGTGTYVQNVGIIESYADEDVGDNYISTTGELSEGARVLYPLADPIEAALTADEIAAFLALKTYSGTTIITNDADAYMDVGHKAKKE